MTQLTLFDAPTSTTPVVSATGQATPQQADSGPQRMTVEPVEGVQRMGDLARLVLLRYQLVAQRRAAQAAREVCRGN